MYVAGHRGLVGSAVWRHLEGGLHGPDRGDVREVDLRREEDVWSFFDAHRPDVLVLAAARVGGILANATRPADFLGDNLRIQVDVSRPPTRSGSSGCCSSAHRASTPSWRPSRSRRARC